MAEAEGHVLDGIEPDTNRVSPSEKLEVQHPSGMPQPVADIKHEKEKSRPEMKTKRHTKPHEGHAKEVVSEKKDKHKKSRSKLRSDLKSGEEVPMSKHSPKHEKPRTEIAEEVHQIVSHGEGLRRRNLDKTENKKRDLSERRKALVTDAEIKSILKILGPIYQRRIFVEQLKSRWYLVVLPLLFVIAISVVSGFVILPMFSEEVVKFIPPEPVHATWKVYELRGYNLIDFATTWETKHTKVWAKTTLVSKISPIYDSLLYPISSIVATSLDTSGKDQSQGRATAVKETLFTLKHDIHFSDNETDYADVKIDLTLMMKTARRNLLRSKDWRINPSDMVMQQGAAIVRSASTRSFLTRPIPPVDLKSVPLPLSRVSRIPKVIPKQCDAIFIPSLTEVKPYNCTFTSATFPAGAKCQFSCPSGYTLLGSEVRACLPTGVWDGLNPRCSKPCPPLPPLLHGRMEPSECTTNTTVNEDTRCVHICSELHVLSRRVIPVCKKDGSWSAQSPLCKRQCAHLKIPDELVVVPALCASKPTTQGDVCVFSCREDTLLYGETSIACDSNGRWTDEVPVCRTKCPKLDTVANSEVHPTTCDKEAMFDGMSCVYNCLPGFRLLGPPTRSCTKHGNWTGDAPRCVHTCEEIDSPANGDVLPVTCATARVTSGTFCVISCDSGFASDGPTNLTCTESGVWDIAQPRCLANCPGLNPPVNSDLMCSGHVEESTCALSCLKGYRLRGSGFVMCQADGTWTEALGKCEKLCPTLLSPENAQIAPLECTVVESILGFACEVTCDLSYGISGSARRVCTANGTWTGEAATCTYEKQFQLVLNVKKTSVCAESEKNTVKKRPSDDCEPSHGNLWSIHQGHLLKNSKTGLCLGFDALKPMANATMLKCNASDPRQSWEWPETTNENYTLKIRGQPLYLWYGYRTSDKMYASEKPNVQTNWLLKNLETSSVTSFFGAVHNGYCPPLEVVAHGRWSPDTCDIGNSPSGQLCSFLCSQGYEIDSGTSTVTCANGLWQGGTSPNCVPICQALDGLRFTNGSVSPPTCFSSAFLARGATCAFQCEPDFVLVGEQNIACGADARWTGEQPRCERKCPPFSLRSNSRIVSKPSSCPNPTGMSDEGNVCGIGCNDGYVLKGSAAVLCLADGQWNDTSQQCIRTCLRPKVPRYGSVQCDSGGDFYPHGTTCFHSCLGGRSLIPSSKANASCLESGVWNVTTPACQYLCAPLLPVRNATIMPEDCAGPEPSPNSKLCRYICDPDFSIVTPAQSVCLSTGKWSEPSARCLPSHHFSLHPASNGSCVSVSHYSHHNSYFVIKRPPAQCGAFNATSQWLRTAAGQLKHVKTGWCLAVSEAQVNEVVRLIDCDTGDANQRWECGITETAFAVYIKGTDLMLQSKPNIPSLFVGKLTTKGRTHSWLAVYNDGNNGSVCGTSLGASDSCPKIVLTEGTAIEPFSCQGQVVEGTNCTVTCDEGYELSSGSTTAQIKCQKYGKWSSFDLFCKRRSCKALQLSPDVQASNAACMSANVAPWSAVSCDVTCDTGFRVLRSGASGELWCLGNGMWSEPMPECVSYCPALSAPSDGTVSPKERCTTSNVEGDVCGFSCLTHYRLVGVKQLECMAGAWSASPPVCQKIVAGSGKCEWQNPPNYGYIVPLQCIMSSIAFNQSCSVTCAPGFQPVPRDVNYVCQNDGSWSRELPQCKRICPNFGIPPHASMEPQRCTTGLNTEGEICTIVCDSGYSTNENRHVTCTQSGQWDAALSSCEKVAHFLIKISGASSCLTAASEASGLVHFAPCDYQNDKQKWEWLSNRHVRSVGLLKCLNPESELSYSSLNLSSCEDADAEWKCSFDASSIHQTFHHKNFVLGYSVLRPRVAFIVDPSKDDEEWISKRGIHFYGINETAVGTVCSYRSAAICMGLSPIENGLVESNCDGSSDHIKQGIYCRYSCETGYQLIGKQSRVCQGNGLWNDVSKVECKRSCPPFQPVFYEVTPVLCVDGQPFEGTECRFQCTVEFERSGPETRVCQTDGTWSEEEVICHKNCLARQDPSGQLKATPEDCLTKEQTSGSVCRFSCPNGYILMVNPVHTCLNDGSWTSGAPICVRSCPALKPVTNGRILPTNCAGPFKGAGDACVYSCTGAHSLDGNKIRSCTGEGIWTGRDPVCRTTCPALIAPPNGEIKCFDEKPLAGNMCTYSCNPNYVIEGPTDRRSCLQSGLWSDSEPTCTHEFQFMIFQSTPPDSTLCLHASLLRMPAVKDESKCSFDFAWDRWAWYHEDLIRNVATRLCLAGTSLIDDPHITLEYCDPDSRRQRWECPGTERSWFFRLTTFRLYPISLPYSTFKILLHSDTSIDFMISKNSGITQHTSFYAKTVLTNRTYICSARRENICRPIKAGSKLVTQPLPCTGAQSPVGTQCRFSCEANYILGSAVESVRCLKSGRWSGDVPTCLRACPPLQVSHNSSVQFRPTSCAGTASLPEKFSCTASCPSGYQLVGQSALTCLRSHVWDANIPKCKAICPVLSEIRHGVVEPSECTSHDMPILEGTQCSYTCPQVEHVLSGSAETMCKADGKWSTSEPACVKPCPVLPAPSEGKVVPGRCSESSSLADTVCAFSCDPTLIHVGSAYRVCQANGSWTGKQSICQAPCPSAVNAEDNYLLEPVPCANEFVTPGRECKVICKPGFQLQGNEQITCMPDGTWSDELGECLRRCPKLTKLENGQVLPTSCLGGDLFEGQECEFSCQTQHILLGSDIRYCDSNGTWTGEAAQCVQSCDGLGEQDNVRFDPESCQSQPQKVGTSCHVFCPTGTGTPYNKSSVTLKCQEYGEWSGKPISRCLTECGQPLVQNGAVACRTPLGRPTEAIVIGTRCDVKCVEDHVPMAYVSSVCEEIDDETANWSPPIAQCEYEPDPMIIVNRIGFATYCLGETDFKVTLVEWEKCADGASQAGWTWQGPNLIRNIYTGRCIAGAEANEIAFVITSICNDSDALQQWICDSDQPYSLRMLRHELRLDTSREKSDGVILRSKATAASLLYTYNPETETETGTLCSRRDKGQCAGLYLPEGTHPLETNCGAESGDVDKMCQVRCLHSQDAPIDVTCTVAGIWEPDLKIVCAPSCRTPPTPQGLARYEESACADIKLDIKSVCTLMCPDGYAVVGGERFTTCMEDMRWEPINDYDCIKTCPSLDTPDHGHQNKPRCTYGICTLKCDPDYRVEGSKSRKCQSSGKWSGEPFSCVPEVQFRIVSVNRYQKQTVCLTITSSLAVVKAACINSYLPQLWRWNSRYTLQSVDNEYCLTVNRSVAKPTDTAAQLGRIRVGRVSNVSNTSTTNAPPIVLPFEPGKSGPMSVTPCNATDEIQRWDCASKPNSLSQPYLKLFDLHLFLDAGPVYRGALDVKSVAMVSSEWFGGHYSGKRGLCGFRSTGVCPPLEAPYDGSVDPDLCRGEYIVEGTRCKFSCEHGFAMRGELVVLCNKGGEWSSESPICIGIESCPALSPDRLMRITPRACVEGEVQDGTVCKIKCPPTTVLNGAASTLCKIDGKWSESLPTCDPVCPAIQPPINGEMSPDLCEQDHRPVGTVCKATCLPGYTLVGDRERSCLPDNEWSGKRADCLLFCLPLEPVRNGNIVPKSCEFNSSAPRQICRFSCAYGTFLVGVESITCTDGNWSLPKPVCSDDWCPRTKLDLSNTEDITYDKLNNGAIGPSSTLSVTCLTGFTLVGPAVRVCQTERTWSFANVTCRKFRCKPLLRLYHRKLSSQVCHSKDGVVPDTICQFTCDDSYLLVGAKSTECQLNGRWSPDEDPECVDTLEAARSASFTVALHLPGNPNKCLTAAKTEKYVHLVSCDRTDGFQLWQWYGSERLQNVARQDCLTLSEHRKVIMEACNLGNNRQIVKCASLNVGSTKFKMLLGGFAIDDSLYGQHRIWEGSYVWFGLPSTNHPTWINSNSKVDVGSLSTVCSFMCGTEYSALLGDFSTPNYPNPYPRDVSCYWVVRSSKGKRVLHLHFSAVRLKNPTKKPEFRDAESGESANAADYLAVYEGKTSRGNVLQRTHVNSPKFSVSTLYGHVTVLFYSDHRSNPNANGFSAHWFTSAWPKLKRGCAIYFRRLIATDNAFKPLRSQWQAMVLYRQYFACNAFMISGQVFLTSAHCIEHYSHFDDIFQFSQYQVVVSFADQTDLMRKKEKGGFMKVTKIVLHPNFSRNNLIGDLALVFVKQKIASTPTVTPICIPNIPDGRIAGPEADSCWALQWLEDMLFKSAASKKWAWTRFMAMRILDDRDCLSYVPSSNLGEYLCAKKRLPRKSEIVPTVPEGLSFKPETEGVLLQCPFNINWYAVGISTVALHEEFEVYIFTNLELVSKWIDENA